MTRPGRGIVAIGLLTLGLGGAAFAQSPGAGAFPPDTALPVPYLAQSELLCGGAAVAMVERWWGRRRVYAEDFATLVRPDEGGIRTDELADAVKRRGYDTQVFAGAPDMVRRYLDARTPVVALIGVGRNRYHYVVIVAWGGEQVVFHDPARAPGMRRSEKDFLASWDAAGRWTLVMRPGSSPDSARAGGRPQPDPPLPCSPWLDLAVDSADAGRMEAASTLLDEARLRCPEETVVLREQAGLRFRERRYDEAARLASKYVARAPYDEHGWRLLAASRYLAGDPGGALEAWNRIGQPTVDLVRVEGLHRTRFREASRAIAVAPGKTLTSARLALARRRLEDLPALSGTTVDFRPVEGELVELEARVAERPLVPRPLPFVATSAVRAVAQEETRLELATPAGTGELWTASWRWTSARPRVALELKAPARLGIPGVASVVGEWERFRLPSDSSSGGVEAERRSGDLRFGAWITPGFRAVLGVRYERWQDQLAFLAPLGGIEVRLAGDRLILAASGELAARQGSGASYTTGRAEADWISSEHLEQARWSARAAYEVAGRHAPRAIWPVAGRELSWALPLRAHSAAIDGRISAGTTGRGILHGGIGADHPIYRAGPIVLAAGVFLDAARTFRTPAGSPERTYVDGGVGLRIGGFRMGSSAIRIDLATGLTDRATGLSASVEAR